MVQAFDLGCLDTETLAALRAKAEFERARGSPAAAVLLGRVEGELRARREREVRARNGHAPDMAVSGLR
jgi:hypothetical protein